MEQSSILSAKFDWPVVHRNLATARDFEAGIMICTEAIRLWFNGVCEPIKTLKIPEDLRAKYQQFFELHGFN